MLHFLRVETRICVTTTTVLYSLHVQLFMPSHTLWPKLATGKMFVVSSQAVILTQCAIGEDMTKM